MLYENGEFERIRPHLTPLECGIIFDGIPEGAISRKVGLIWGIPVNTFGGTTTLVNSIVAHNVSGGDCNQANISQGHNLDSDGTCRLGGTGDLSNVDPKLGTLEDNGGPTFTHALLEGSPAIDAGDDSICSDTDQRDFLRPLFAGACDIGAYEFGALPPHFPYG